MKHFTRNKLVLYQQIYFETPATTTTTKQADWNLDIPLFSYGNMKCMFVDFLTGYMVTGFSIVFTIECRVVIDI